MSFCLFPVSASATGTSVGSGQGIRIFSNGYFSSTAGGTLSLTDTSGFTDGGAEGGLQLDSEPRIHRHRHALGRWKPA